MHHRWPCRVCTHVASVSRTHHAAAEQRRGLARSCVRSYTGCANGRPPRARTRGAWSMHFPSPHPIPSTPHLCTHAACRPVLDARRFLVAERRTLTHCCGVQGRAERTAPWDPRVAARDMYAWLQPVCCVPPPARRHAHRAARWCSDYELLTASTVHSYTAAVCEGARSRPHREALARPRVSCMHGCS